MTRPSQSVGQGRFQIGDAARCHAKSRDPLRIKHAQQHVGPHPSQAGFFNAQIFAVHPQAPPSGRVCGTFGEAGSVGQRFPCYAFRRPFVGQRNRRHNRVVDALQAGGIGQEICSAILL